jgi:predicted small secreted protein
MKKIVMFAALLALILTLTACTTTTGNRAVGGKDIQTFNYCYVRLDGEEIEKGFVTQWRDYDNSDVVQVLVNGKYYLTHYSNVVLISDPSLSPMTYSNASMFGVDE